MALSGYRAQIKAMQLAQADAVEAAFTSRCPGLTASDHRAQVHPESVRRGKQVSCG